MNLQDALEARIQLARDHDRLVRSQIVYEAITLESVVDRIIATHFCSDESKHPAFFSFIFRDGEISFSNKIRILKKILGASYPSLAKISSALAKKLDSMRDLRNKFAHSELVLPSGDEPSNLDIKLKYYRNGHLEVESLSEADITRQINDCRLWHVTLELIAVFVKQVARGEQSQADKAVEELWTLVQPDSNARRRAKGPGA